MSKYFSHKLNHSINTLIDGCSLDDWPKMYTMHPFAWHPKGFMVFLSPDEISTCDEYAEEDPYSVATNQDGDFQQRRIECTLHLLQVVMGKGEDSPRILDIGCGQGHVTDKIHQLFPKAEISALDYSVSAIDYAVDHFTGIDFIVCNALECPYENNYFDVVICNNLWEHVPDPINLMNKISRLLKFNGHIVVSTPSRYRLSNIINILRRRPVSLVSKNHVTEYSVGQVIEQLKYCGFDTVKVFSKPIKLWSIKSQIINYMFSMLLLFLKIQSYHLESTVFFLAQYNNRAQIPSGSFRYD